MESLDNGEPAYYNSNILGRYMRKNYGNFATDNLKIRMNGLLKELNFYLKRIDTMMLIVLLKSF